MPVFRADQRPLGVVYTPPEVARPMVELVLEPLVRDKRASELLALRVCDPAVGAGAFLVEVVDVLAERLARAWSDEDRTDARADHGEAPTERAAHHAGAPPRRGGGDQLRLADARRAVADACVVGVDIDAAAIEAARAATGAGPDALRAASALALDWRAAFPGVFARGGFDAVIANPPYIRQERRADKAALARFASHDGVADLYVYFVELAHELLRPGGRYGLIVPNKWMTVAYGRALRSYLAARGSVDGIVDLADRALFADADAFPCIVWGTIGAPRARPIRALRPDASMTVAEALRAADARDHAPPRDEAPLSRDHPRDHPLDHPLDHPRDRWHAEPWHIDTPTERALLDRLERRWPRLGELVPGRPARGVVTGCNRAFVIDRATRDRLLAAEPTAARLIRPFLKGRDLRPWRSAPPARWILLVGRGTSLDELPAVRAHLAQFRAALEPRPPAWRGPWRGRKPGSYAWHELQDPVGPLVRTPGPRLLYQDIQTAPVCSLDPTGEVVPDTTVWMLPTADPFLLAVLNSAVYGWYARRRFPPALNGAVRPKLAYLRTLPVPVPDPALQRSIAALVERRLALAPRSDAPEVRELDAQLAGLIADAYELSTRERALIEP